MANLTPKLVEGDIILSSPDDSSSLISESSPATSVMTDLTVVKAVQIESSASIDAINEKMIASGVRLLFVNNHEGKLVGLVTSVDTLGEKPIRFIQENGVRRDEIEAADIMTPITKFEGIPYSEIRNATVADVVEVFENSRRHHLLVICNKKEIPYIQGLISASHVARVLDREITQSQRADSFAQLNKALT